MFSHPEHLARTLAKNVSDPVEPEDFEKLCKAVVELCEQLRRFEEEVERKIRRLS